MKLKSLLWLVILALLSTSPSRHVNAGIPVIDATNLSQNMTSAIESVTQTLKQVEQYTLQLQQYMTQIQQYENMLKNTLAPVAYIWDSVQTTINGVLNTVDTISAYKQQFESLDNYLGKFQDVSYYRNSPCFSSSGCSSAERAIMEQNRTLASESQKKANDALIRVLDKQQNALKTDARTIERLQSNAQSAGGQMQALGAANQLASAQTNQLLQIRALLIAQQNALAAQMQAQVDSEAQKAAATEQLVKNRFSKSSDRGWSLRSR